MNKRRKNYLPTLVLTLVLWLLWGGLIYFVEPELVTNFLIPHAYLPFFMLFWPASFLTLAIVLGNSRRGFLVSLGLVLFLGLRLVQLGNVLNFLLILGILIAVDRYFN